jgi:hypothetical protein
MKRAWCSVVVLLVLLLSLGGRISQSTARPAEGQEISLAEADLIFLGESANDWSAYSVSPAGDVNRDGYADLLNGAPYAGDPEPKGPGKAYLILGRPRSAWPGTPISLADADASFIGPLPKVMTARQNYTAGDINADGYDELLITGWQCGAERGCTYLFKGRPNIDWGQNCPVEQADSSFLGEQAGDRSGYYVATVGDVNGDGYDDFLIAAVGSDEGGGFRAGEVYLILGNPVAEWGQYFILSGANASFIGEAEGDAAGRSATGVGDVNGDGYDDLMVGAPFNDEAGVDAGQAYLILGRAAADWGMHYPLSQADASFVGEAAGDQLGRRVSGAGDVNRDGYPDLLLGASYNDQAAPDAGKAYLFLGHPEVDWGPDYPAAQADASFLGEGEGDQAGRRVSAAGDLNDDGYGDFLISAPHNSRSAPEAGAAYLFYGRAAADWGMDLPLAQADVIYVGEGDHDHAGYDAAPIGDMDGDGIDDLVIGAYGADVNGEQSGTMYVILGKTGPHRVIYLPAIFKDR